jgi:hypothetical protein
MRTPSGQLRGKRRDFRICRSRTRSITRPTTPWPRGGDTCRDTIVRFLLRRQLGRKSGSAVGISVVPRRASRLVLMESLVALTGTPDFTVMTSASPAFELLTSSKTIAARYFAFFDVKPAANALRPSS